MVHRETGHKKDLLRKGFSTGTAATAAVVAAVKILLGKPINGFVAVRLPLGFYIPIPVEITYVDKYLCITEVIKDGGDDPDITHGATVRARVSLIKKPDGLFTKSGVWLDAGEGIGVVTKPGLPVPPGEPAINPVPRQMMSENISIATSDRIGTVLNSNLSEKLATLPSANPSRRIFIPLEPEIRLPFDIHALLSIPGGEILAKKTLNPRLGILEGLSILGTNGLVKPFSHEAYEETIDYALRFAKTNGCSSVVLSTGGKSELYARKVFSGLSEAAFIQIADFFGFSVKRAQQYNFSEIIHAVFFGKAVKMALGFYYTHAKEGLIDMKILANIAELSGKVKRAVIEANTAKHVLDILKKNHLQEAIQRICRRALEISFNFSPLIKKRQIILFDYDGTVIHKETLVST